MKTAVVRLEKDTSYRVSFYDGEKLFDVRVGRSRSKVRDFLNASGVYLRDKGQTHWWPREIGESRKFIVDSPANWFWAP